MSVGKKSFTLLGFLVAGTFSYGEDRIPFYEDYLANDELGEFVEAAQSFLEDSPDAAEAPRLAMDLMMIGKGASRPEIVDYATDLLLFKYPSSLPSLQFFSSFDQGSPRLVKLLGLKAEQGDLGSEEFASNYCRTLLFIARIQGPELLKDPSLRLRAFLLASKAGVDEIESTAETSLKNLSGSETSLGQTIQVVFSEEDTLEKIKRLGRIKGTDAKFCASFYLAQLDPQEAQSEELVVFRINQILFGPNPDTSLARELFSSLPKARIEQPPMQALLAFSHHLDQEPSKAIELLDGAALGLDPQSEWNLTFKSYADGLMHLENRKNLFVEALGKAIDGFSMGGDCLYVSAQWESNSSQETPAENHLFLGVDKASERFEIQLRRNEKLLLGYKSGKEESSILGPDSPKIFKFQASGAYPVPRISIARDNLSGSFNYNFNLNFGSSFAEFFDSGSSLLENPYLGTAKGREVLWTYTLGRKFIWLEPAESASEGTTYPVASLSQGESKANKSSVTFDLEGNFKRARINRFLISEISLGDQTVLDKLPKWPEAEVEKKEDFDFPMFMKLVSVIGSITQGG